MLLIAARVRIPEQDICSCNMNCTICALRDFERYRRQRCHRTTCFELLKERTMNEIQSLRRYCCFRGSVPARYAHRDKLVEGGEIDIRSNNRLSGYLLFYAPNMADKISLRYGGWFFVLLAVLLTLATILFAAMASYCFFYQHGSFTGHWYWVNWGLKVAVECRT